LFEGFGDSDSFDVLKDAFDIVRVSGASRVEEDVAGLVVVHLDEFVLDEFDSVVVVSASSVVREAKFEVVDEYLVLEEIDFVEEDDDRFVAEPSTVAEVVEELNRLVHSVHGFVFEQSLVVFAEGQAKDDRPDSFEAVDPFLPLRPLAADVDEPKRVFADIKNDLFYA